MKPFLMGTEVEYAVSGRTAQGPVLLGRVYDALASALRQERLCLPDVLNAGGLYLEHGARFYFDYHEHPEYATPECFTPVQVAAQDKGGEYLMRLAKRRAEQEEPGLRLTIIKNNLDPIEPDENSYGCHESYTGWMPLETAQLALVPHLVSRIIYAGSGSLSGREGAMGFELSQRARHLMCVTGGDTMNTRPIFCTRVRKPSDHAEGWTRLHLIGKDSQRSPFGIYLTFAVTGLLVEILNRGGFVGEGLELADPVQALQDISRDPWLKVRVPLADGRQLTAVEIQACYLDECERELAAGTLPEWAPEALRHWRETLADLERDPLLLADRLDPYCKLLLFGGELRKARAEWSDVQRGLNLLGRLRSEYAAPVATALVQQTPGKVPAIYREQLKAATAVVAADGAGAVERMRLAVRLQALDLRYHELGGLYDALSLLGKVQSVVLTDEDMERATREAPPGGRAALRGAAIKANRGPDWVCDWQYLLHPPTGTCVDLRDPFAAECRVVSLPDPPEEHARASILERLASANP